MKYALLWVSIFLVTGCQINSFVPDKSRMFNINGKWVEITEELQKDLRSNWSKGVEPVVIKTGIPAREDVLYILDSIAIQEVITGDDKCKNYEMLSITKTDRNQLSEEDKKYPVGRLDETWRVSMCGHISRYRVFEIDDERGISSYKLRP